MGTPLLRAGSTERTLRSVSQMPTDCVVYFWRDVSWGFEGELDGI